MRDEVTLPPPPAVALTVGWALDPSYTVFCDDRRFAEIVWPTPEEALEAAIARLRARYTVGDRRALGGDPRGAISWRGDYEHRHRGVTVRYDFEVLGDPVFVVAPSSSSPSGRVVTVETRWRIRVVAVRKESVEATVDGVRCVGTRDVEEVVRDWSTTWPNGPEVATSSHGRLQQRALVWGAMPSSECTFAPPAAS